ncbi:acyltransferase family protein [Croceibacterium ferulae]|uniref:acyltransferase family protein n=1 Tax=Croceibacterium ferulae TaxID=1854641 RepID=UPI000F8921C8|nr:acyltransferase [Croceibacterium ferulae]
MNQGLALYRAAAVEPTSGQMTATGGDPGPAEKPCSRLSYVDAAKGIAVILVVLWHAVGDRLLIFEALVYLRMPLFFFAAGLFAQRGLDARWKDFLPVRVGQIFWLYLLWVPIVYYMTTGATEMVRSDLSLEEGLEPATMLIDPPNTLWFLYALGLMYLGAKLVRPFNWQIVLGASFAAYAVVISGWFTFRHDLLEMLCRLAALAPFFLIASYHSQIIRTFIQDWAHWALRGLAAYFFIAVAIVAFDGGFNPLATFSASIIGVASLLMLLYRHSTSITVRTLNKLGRQSLFVFVLHRIPLYYYNLFLAEVGMQNDVLALTVGGLAIVVGCWALGEHVLSRYARWTMEAPWLTKHRVRASS